MPTRRTIRPVSRHPEVKAIVDALVGTWAGEGTGQYPTIDPFEYRETLEFADRTGHPSLHYEQRAWRKTADGEVVSHWETGLFRISSDGSILLFNAQGGRAEAMAGTWVRDGDSWTVRLQSTGYAGDDRVTASQRSLQIAADSLTYEMEMESTATLEMSLHLSATLTRNNA